MELNDIYKDFEIENDSFECKARLDKENILGWLKTIDAFSNTKGGILFIGVDDKTNKLIGFELKEIDKEKLYLFNQLKEHFVTMPYVNIDLIPYIINNKKRYILKVNVAESDTKPIMLKYQGMPMIFTRKDGYTSAATPEEIIFMSTNSKHPKFDLQKTDIKFNINDFTMLSKFYKENTNNELKEKELAAINFFDENHFLTNGALLFKDDYDGNDSKVVCSLYKGLTRGDNQIIASNSFQGNLIKCYEYIYEFVNQRMNHGFIKKETKRIDIDAFPKRSLFEAIINSLAHRDYFISGSAIYVDMFKNRLVISSPGGLYGSGDVKKTYKLDYFISRRRNELICDVFIMCKAMEAKGTGFEKIMDDYKNENESHKPFIFSKNNQFSIVLPDLTYEDGITLDDESLQILENINNGSKYDISILAFCYNTNKSIKDITNYLNVSNSTFFRKKIIMNLVLQNFLIEKEEGNTKTYYTNHNLVLRK